MEIYKQREYDLQNAIDNVYGIDGTFQNYRDEVNRFIGNLLEETVEINTLRHSVKEKDKEIERLNNVINELEKDIQKEIDRTNDLILEDGGLGEITTIRKMLNETRECILFRIKKLKEGKE